MVGHVPRNTLWMVCYREVMKSNMRKWCTEMSSHLKENPKRAPLYVIYTLYLALWYGVTSRFPIGLNVYEKEWDILIVLDACRVDTLRNVAHDYDFVKNVDSRWSVGSQSAEWLANTFTSQYLEEIRGTSYLSSNGYSEAVIEKGSRPPANNTTPIDFSSWSVVDDGDLKSHEKLWHRHHDETYGVVLPETMTNYAIETSREDEAERVIVHYTQPHLPYAGRAFSEGREPNQTEKHGYELLENGSISHDEVYEVYKETLRWVLDDVEVLLENVDAEKVVITSDHGEAFGEWKAYGHPEGFPHPAVRKVPWVETTARDEHTREPNIDVDSSVQTDIEEHLQDLGYR